jgi:hypothetical protein
MMTLSSKHLNILSEAIEGYTFPCAYYDFINGRPSLHQNMFLVEKLIRDDLVSGEIELVKNGLSNVLYWGFAQVGYRDKRVSIFRDQVSKGQLYDASKLFPNINGDGLQEIKKLRLPQFSGMSFISKVRMFLDPTRYVILDKKILEMYKTPSVTLLKAISFGPKETQIRISDNNCRVYLSWCAKCVTISNIYYEGKYRAVDVERGFFTLVQKKHADTAAEILSLA